MADGADNIANLSVGVEADFSGLQQAIDNAANAVQSAADRINASFSTVEQSSQHAESAVHGLAEQFASLAEALVVTEGLREFGQEALNAYGTVQSVTIGLTELTKSAEQANEIISQVKELAATEPFAFPEIAPTIQKMVALGVSAEQIPGVMHAVADAAAATGNSFQTIANSFDRMTLSGTVSAKSLVQLGINTQQLGAAMGVTADQVKVAFAALDQSQRIQVLEDALQKFAGAAEAQAKGIAGQWQIFQNQFEEVMVGVGEALAPVVGDILSFGKSVLSAIQTAAEAFEKLPGPVKDTAVVVGLLLAAVAPLAAAVSAAGFAIIGFNTAIETGSSILTRLGITAEEAAIAETEFAASCGRATIAEGEAAAAANELAVSQGRLGVAGAATAEEVGLLSGAVTFLSGVALPAVIGATAGWQLGKLTADAGQTNESIKVMTGGMGAWVVATNAATDAIPALENVLTQLNQGLNVNASAVTDVTNRLGLLLQPLGDVTKQQLTANAAVGQARVALELAKEGYANASLTAQQHALALQVLQRAQVNYDDAVQAATKHGKDWADTVGGITEAIGKAQEKFNSLVTVFAQLSASADGSARSNAVLADVYTKLESAAKASGNTFADYRGIVDQVNASTAQSYATFQQLGAAYGTLLTLERTGVDVTAQLATVYQQWQAAASKVGESISTAAGEMAKLVQAAQGQQTALEGVAGAFVKLAAIQNPTLSQQEALVQAFKKLTDGASAMGIEVNAAGGSIAFSAKAGTEASTALVGYIDKLNAIFTSSDNLVKINGKWQLSSESLTAVNKLLADATSVTAKAATDATGAIKNHSDSLDGNAAASQRARQAQIDLGSTYQTTQTLVTNLTNAGKQQVSSVEDAVKAFVDLDSQTQTTVAGQIALQNAFRAAKDAAAALGITLTSTGASASGNATPAVQALAKQLNDAIQSMNGGSAAGNQFSGVLDKIASSANSAAGAMKDFIEEANAEPPGGGFGGKNLSPTNAEGTLSLMASMGADDAELDSAAQAFGLVPVGNRQYVTQDEFIQMTGGNLQVSASGQLVAKPKASGTDEFGRPIASSSTSSGGSGIQALASSATAAATAITTLGTASTSFSQGGLALFQSAVNGTGPQIVALGTAATSAATPLGAFVTGTGAAATSIVALSKSVADLSQITGTLTVQDQANAQGGADWLKTLANLSPALQEGADQADAAAQAQEKLSQAADALQSATQRDVQAVEDGTLAQSDATADIGKYSQAVAEATKEVADLGIGAMNLSKELQGFSNAVPDWMKQIEAAISQNPALGPGANPQTFTTAPPVLSTNPVLGPGGTPFSLGSKEFNPANAIDAGSTALGTGGLGSLNGGLTLSITLQGGTYVGPNAGKQLADMMMPNVIAMLRQAGQKL